ncbi:MAG: tetratricopeptide repeat protein [Gammaproteobacteria bacterium]
MPATSLSSRAACGSPRHLLGAAALAAFVALGAGCASPPPPAAQAPSAESSAAALAQYEEMAHKLHSPRLVAKLLFKQAQQKKDAEHAMLAALLALRAGDAKLADEAAALAEKLAPDQSETWAVQMQVALARADLAAAGKAAVKAYALGGAQNVAIGLDGAVDPWFAYSIVAPLAQAHPKDGAMQLVFARTALDAGDTAAALAAAQAAHSFEPGERAAKLIEIQARWGLGQRKEALAQAARALADNSRDTGFRVFYANLLARAGQRMQAREVLNDARALAPDDPQVTFGYALLAADEGKVAAAHAQLTAMLETGSDSTGVYNLLGQLAAHEGKWGEAFGWYESIQSADDLASSRVSSLFTLARWKGMAAAEDYLTQLERGFQGLAPTWAGVHATLLAQDGKQEAAWKLLGTTLERYPMVRPLRYQRALLADQLGKGADALAGLKRLVGEEPQNPMYLNAYGYTLTEHTTRYRDAYGYIKRALAINPDDGAALDSMGWVLYRLGESEKSLDYLRRAWKTTKDIDVARHLVTVYLALDERGEATRVLTVALAKSPKDPALLQLKRQLAKQ